MIRRHAKKLVIVALLITLGLVLEILGLLDAGQLLAIARGYAQHWWLIPVLILAQTILFTFALAGSLFLWIVAPLYDPAMATFILVAGGTMGGVGAYLFSGYLTEEWKLRIQNSRSYKLLHAEDNFLSLFAMRVFPGFPHSLVNYSSGILNAKLTHFVIAAVLGIGIKSYIYARVINSAASTMSLQMLLDVSVIGPLIFLSMSSALGVYIHYRITAKPG